MYLKKTDGPRAVTLADGSVLSRADLPPKGTCRWVASRKAVVVRAVEFGLLPRSEAIERYALTEEELDSWFLAVQRYGTEALKATTIQKYRQI